MFVRFEQIILLYCMKHVHIQLYMFYVLLFYLFYIHSIYKLYKLFDDNLLLIQIVKRKGSYNKLYIKFEDIILISLRN